MTLTYNPNIAKVKVNIHTKYQGRRSNGSAVRAQTDGHPNGQTDGQTDGRYQVHYLPRFAVDKYGSAVCVIHKTYVQGAIMSKWFDCEMSKNEHWTEKAHDLRNNLVERFLRSVSKLITDEVLFIDIGVELDLKWDEIKTIRTDNPNSIVNAGYQALQEWRNKIQTNDITVIKETLLEAFTTCKVGSQFQQVAQKFEL